MLDNRVEAETCRKGKIVEEYFAREIAPLDSRLAFRGISLIQAVDFSEFPDPSFCACVRKGAFANRLVIESAGRNDSALKVMPPLTIDDATLLKGLDILRDSIMTARSICC